MCVFKVVAPICLGGFTSKKTGVFFACPNGHAENLSRLGAVCFSGSPRRQLRIEDCAAVHRANKAAIHVTQNEVFEGKSMEFIATVFQRTTC